VEFVLCVLEQVRELFLQKFCATFSKVRFVRLFQKSRMDEFLAKSGYNDVVIYDTVEVKKITGGKVNETLFIHSFMVDELELLRGRLSIAVISVKDRNGKEVKFKGCRNNNKEGKHIYKYFKLKILSSAYLREWVYANKNQEVESRGPYHVIACNILLYDFYCEDKYILKYVTQIKVL